MSIIESLGKVVNDEQLLDFALEHVCERAIEDINSVAHFIITLYIIQDFAKQEKYEFTEEEIREKYSELMASKLLLNMTNKGLIETNFDENGEILYQLTQKGKNKIYDN